MMSSLRLAAAVLLGATSVLQAQERDRRFTLEARGGLNVPTFDIADAVDAGPSIGVGASLQLSPRVWVLGDVDLGFHSGPSLGAGIDGPDAKVYHYIGKLGYSLLPEGSSPWSVIVNAGGGAMTFDVDGGSSNTYPAINVGAKIAYQLSPRASLLLSPQGDIAFTDEAEVGTSTAWVWPFTVGLRLGL
jgi:Outer membrane protein beta-barrel domain